jgi:hypothetical protein
VGIVHTSQQQALEGRQAPLDSIVHFHCMAVVIGVPPHAGIGVTHNLNVSPQVLQWNVNQWQPITYVRH